MQSLLIPHPLPRTQLNQKNMKTALILCLLFVSAFAQDASTEGAVATSEPEPEPTTTAVAAVSEAAAEQTEAASEAAAAEETDGTTSAEVTDAQTDGPTEAGPSTAGPTTAGPTTAGPTTPAPTTKAPHTPPPFVQKFLDKLFDRLGKAASGKYKRSADATEGPEATTVAAAETTTQQQPQQTQQPQQPQQDVPDFLKKWFESVFGPQNRKKRAAPGGFDFSSYAKGPFGFQSFVPTMPSVNPGPGAGPVNPPAPQVPAVPIITGPAPPPKLMSSVPFFGAQ